MNAKLLSFATAATLAASVGFSSNALADCSEFGNDQWNELSAQMAQAVDAGDYDMALKYGKQLTLICDQSPITNIIISDIYAKIGDEDSSHKYVRRASEFIQQYDVPQPIIEKIWFRRAEFELPYRNQITELQNQLSQKDIEIEGLNAALVDMASSSIKGDENLNKFKADYIKDLDIIKWTGTGMAAGGAILLGVGGALIGIYEPKANTKWKKIHDNGPNDTKKSEFNKLDVKVKAGYAILAGGIGLGVAGATMAIYSAVKEKSLYNVVEVEDETVVPSEDVPAEEGAEVSFNFGLNSAMLQVNF